MPKTSELTVRMEDRPGTLAKCCRALAGSGVNIIAFEAFSRDGQSVVRLVVDNATTAKTALDAEKLNYTEAEVALAKLPNQVGELARAASRLGESNININYAYGGTEPGTNTPLLIFGVSSVARAVEILDEAVAKVA